MSEIESLFAEWQSMQPIKPEYQERLNQKFMLNFKHQYGMKMKSEKP